jgi:hypothetical protein
MITRTAAETFSSARSRSRTGRSRISTPTRQRRSIGAARAASSAAPRRSPPISRCSGGPRRRAVHVRGQELRLDPGLGAGRQNATTTPRSKSATLRRPTARFTSCEPRAAATRSPARSSRRTRRRRMGRLRYRRRAQRRHVRRLWRYNTIASGSARSRPSRARRRRRRSHPRFPDALADPTHHWAHACFSDVEGYPQLVGVWGGRLIFVKGVDLIGSVVGDYWNMAPIDKRRRVRAGYGVPPRALDQRSADVAARRQGISAPRLASEEIVVGQINRAAGISGTNLKRATAIRLRLGRRAGRGDRNGVMFVQRGGKKIREAAFSYEQGRFVGSNINIYARHITRSRHQVAGMAARARGAALGRPRRRDADRSPAQPRASGQGLLEARARARHRDRRRRSLPTTAPRTSFGSSPSSTALRRSCSSASFGMRTPGSSKPTPSLSIGA